MARFKGSVRGTYGMATRLGNAESGMVATVKTHRGNLKITVSVIAGRDYARMVMVRRDGRVVLVYDGPVEAIG